MDGPACILYVRIDRAADRTALRMALAHKGAFFGTKANLTADLCGAVARASRWTTACVSRRARRRRAAARASRGVVKDNPFGENFSASSNLNLAFLPRTPETRSDEESTGVEGRDLRKNSP